MDKQIDLVEIGIFHGSSLNMWHKYLPKAKIFAYDNNIHLLQDFKLSMIGDDSDFITLDVMDVKDECSIRSGLKKHNRLYDCIIDDSTHEFVDQISIVKNAVDFLKPGGILIIEDIFKNIPEDKYTTALKPLMHNFQDSFFITLDHDRRNSEGWDNDKLLILVKAGAEPIFRTKQEIVIITPSYRTTNLRKLFDSIPFDHVRKWIIVYDGNHVQDGYSQFREHPKIEEHVHVSSGISGNPQRNFGLDIVEQQYGDDDCLYVYFLDDDNICHPDLKRLAGILDYGNIYTFNQEGRIMGNTIGVNKIDTAMFMVSVGICKRLRFIPDKYEADGHFIVDCLNNQPGRWIFVNNDLCFYNKIA
jgi:SAM-dependent methyltransferase